jgi:hypothetical protein
MNLGSLLGLMRRSTATMLGSGLAAARKDAGGRRFKALFGADSSADGMAQLCSDVLRGTGRGP